MAETKERLKWYDKYDRSWLEDIEGLDPRKIWDRLDTASLNVIMTNLKWSDDEYFKDGYDTDRSIV